MRRIARVLIVDDELLVAESLRRVLSDEFEVSSTTEPAAALARLTAGDEWYDVVLCDVMMPGIDGVELHARVSRVAPDIAARFIFVTGGVLLPHVQTRLEGISNLVLAKPFDFNGLRELIRRRTSVRAPMSSDAG